MKFGAEKLLSLKKNTVVTSSILVMYKNDKSFIQYRVPEVFQIFFSDRTT